MGTFAIVLPRYLPEMIGGAETLLQGYALYLQAQGHTIEVLTTTCRDIFPPEHTLDEGVEYIDGLTVRRFRPDSSNIPLYWSLHQRVFDRGENLSYHEQRQLLANQINSSALCGYVESQRDAYDAVLIAPFPFGLTLSAAAAAGAEKAIWVPCLHDETMAYWSMVRESLEGARGILFNTHAEELFARQRLGIVNPCTAVIGAGLPVEPPHGDGIRFRRQHGLDGPIILYAGRIVPQKNVPLLIEYVQRYRREVDPRLRLVLVGRNGLELGSLESEVYYAGELSREELYDAFAAADVFCQPSLNESFSIVMMEAWQQRRPALVHAMCTVTREHIERSDGGWVFDDFATFRTVLDMVLNQPEQAMAAGERGFNYVQANYAWPVVIASLESALTQILAPATLLETLQQRGIQHSLEFTREHYEARLDTMLESQFFTRPLNVEHLITMLHEHATLSLTDYHVHSGIPVVGDAVAWVRRNATSHLKEPYLDPILSQQTAFNHQYLQQLEIIIGYNTERQRQLEHRIRILEAELAQSHQCKEHDS